MINGGWMMNLAIKWIKEHARPLEQARYRYHFESGSKEDVANALRVYQNKDGGFGHGLEPDFNNPNSSPIASWVASKIIDDVGLSKDHQIVVNLIQYFKTTPHKNGWMFHYTIASNNEYAHAPWWTYEENKAISGYNPTASILGFMFNYMDLKDETYKEVIEMIEQAINDFIKKEHVEMHELKCFNELYDYIYLDVNVKKFEVALANMNLKTIEKDHQKWFDTYCAKPLQVISSKHSPGVEKMKDLINIELTEMIRGMNNNGYVDVVWSWSDNHDDFMKAKKAWQGILTLDLLIKIKEFENI